MTYYTLDKNNLQNVNNTYFSEKRIWVITPTKEIEKSYMPRLANTGTSNHQRIKSFLIFEGADLKNLKNQINTSKTVMTP